MATASLPELKEWLVLPAVSSGYPTLGATYKQDGYEIDHAGKLVRTGKHYYDSKAEIPEGMRMSTAGEELAMQLNYELFGEILKRATQEGIRKGGGQADIGINTPDVIERILSSYAKNEREKEAVRYVLSVEGNIQTTDPRKAKVFDDLFARGPDKVYMWQWTETFLRVPRGKQNPGKPDYVDPQGRKYWAREFGNINEVVGVVYVPEGGGRLVAEWDEVFGVPRVTIENRDFPHNPYTTHFWFSATPSLDSTSGQYDVAVGRGCDWHHEVDEGCLDVGANCGRLLAGSGDGFRLVRGSGPEGPKIERELVEKPVVETPTTELVQQLDPTHLGRSEASSRSQEALLPAEIEQAFLERVRTDYRSMPYPDFLKKYDL